MPALALCRWMLQRLASSPWSVLAAALLLASIPLQQALSPLPSAAGVLEQVGLWGPLAATLGMLAGLIALSGIGSFLARLDPASRWGAELAALLTAAIFLLFPTLAGAAAVGAGPVEMALLTPAIFLRLVHLAGLALVLLHPSLPPAPRIALFAVATWLLPGLLAGAAWLAPLTVLLDLQAPFDAPPSAALAPAGAAALSLLLAARLVRRGRAPDES